VPAQLIQAPVRVQVRLVLQLATLVLMAGSFGSETRYRSTVGMTAKAERLADLAPNVGRNASTPEGMIA